LIILLNSFGFAVFFCLATPLASALDLIACFLAFSNTAPSAKFLAFFNVSKTTPSVVVLINPGTFRNSSKEILDAILFFTKPFPGLSAYLSVNS